MNQVLLSCCHVCPVGTLAQIKEVLKRIEKILKIEFFYLLEQELELFPSVEKLPSTFQSLLSASRWCAFCADVKCVALSVCRCHWD